MTLPRLFALVFASFAALLAAPLAADPNDIQAASRAVVRVVLVAEEDGETFYVGHGSGFAVAPNKIVTNAHLIAPLREDSTIRIGIIPSEGTTTYGGRTDRDFGAQRSCADHVEQGPPAQRGIARYPAGGWFVR